ncbi:MAG: hypothetical protein KFB93_08355 [Simkaniaceae bacterium]|nr:MAG: hypothetical protein KFB93_08355 [Simkaniaceae bacterium]
MATSAISESKESSDDSSHPLSILSDALDIVNRRIEGNVIYLGQPGQSLGTPFDIKNLCELALKDGKRIGDVNIVIYREGAYDHAKKERIIKRFCTPQELAEVIERMVEEHLSLKPGILETASGTQFDVSQLKQHTLKIDPEGYFRLNNLRLWSIVWEDRQGPLLAEKLRSDTALALQELEERISIIDKEDPAPAFYIDISKIFTPPSGKEHFYLFCREWKQA